MSADKIRAALRELYYSMYPAKVNKAPAAPGRIAYAPGFGTTIVPPPGRKPQPLTAAELRTAQLYALFDLDLKIAAQGISMHPGTIPRNWRADSSSSNMLVAIDHPKDIVAREHKLTTVLRHVARDAPTAPNVSSVSPIVIEAAQRAFASAKKYFCGNDLSKRAAFCAAVEKGEDVFLLTKLTRAVLGELTALYLAWTHPDKAALQNHPACHWSTPPPKEESEWRSWNDFIIQELRSFFSADAVPQAMMFSTVVSGTRCIVDKVWYVNLASLNYFITTLCGELPSLAGCTAQMLSHAVTLSTYAAAANLGGFLVSWPTWVTGIQDSVNCVAARIQDESALDFLAGAVYGGSVVAHPGDKDSALAETVNSVLRATVMQTNIETTNEQRPGEPVATLQVHLPPELDWTDHHILGMTDIARMNVEAILTGDYSSSVLALRKYSNNVFSRDQRMQLGLEKLT